MLIRLIADLLDKPEVQQQFSQDPTAVMESYGVSAEAREALDGGDRDTILELMGQELSRSTLFGALWAKPGGVTINSVSPTTGAAGTQLTLTVKGDYFASTAFVTLQLGEGNYLAQTLQVTQPDAQGSTLTARVNLPAGAVPGKYAVTVSNPSAWFTLLKDSFTVTAAK